MRAAVPEFDPRAAAAAKAQAALLAAAEEHLGKLLVELQAAMPSLAACGFKASFAKRHAAIMVAMTQSGAALRAQGDAASVAVSAVAPALGFDVQKLRSLLTSPREAWAQIGGQS